MLGFCAVYPLPEKGEPAPDVIRGWRALRAGWGHSPRHQSLIAAVTRACPRVLTLTCTPRSPDERSDIRDVTRQSHLRHLSPRAGRGRFASGALAKRSKSGEGACPQARTRGYAPSPGFLRCARNPTSPRARGGGEQAVRALPPPSSEAYAIARPLKGNGARALRPPGGDPSAHASAWNGISSRRLSNIPTDRATPRGGTTTGGSS